MKKVISLSLAAATTIFAGSITINSGSWNLVGAVSDMNLSDLSCIGYAWTYDPSVDGNYRLYINSTYSNAYGTPADHGYENRTVTNVNQGSGFWVWGMCDQNITFNDINTTATDTTTISPTTTTGPVVVTQATNSSNQLTFSNLTFAINIEDGDAKWFGTIQPSGSGVTITDYDYNGTDWEEHSQNGTLSNQTASTATITFDDGGVYNLSLGTTREVTSIDDTNFTTGEMYETPFTITVVTPSPAETHQWGRQASYYDNDTNQTITVTTNTQMLEMFLTQTSWFSDDYAMLSGASNSTSGNVVGGYVIGTSPCDLDGDNVQDDICENVERNESNIIGTWSFTTTNGIEANLTNENVTLFMSNGYVNQTWQDKVGSIWHENLYTGTEATVEFTQNVIESYSSQYNQN